MTAAFPSNDTAIDFEHVASCGPSSVHVTSPVGISIAEEDPLAAVAVKHEAEIGSTANVAKKVLCRLPVGLVPLADET